MNNSRNREIFKRLNDHIPKLPINGLENILVTYQKTLFLLDNTNILINYLVKNKTSLPVHNVLNTKISQKRTKDKLNNVS